jgi:rubrerythrin
LKGEKIMISGKEGLLDALIEAFLMEKGTREFYAEATAKSVNPEVKKTFKQLSEWEEKHMDFIQFLYQSINDDRKMESFEEFKNKTDAPVTESGIPVKELDKRMERHPVTDEKEALTLAMEIEDKAYNLYHRLSQNAKDGNAQIIFRDMMDQEIKHIKYLKNLRVKLADSLSMKL